MLLKVLHACGVSSILIAVFSIMQLLSPVVYQKKQPIAIVERIVVEQKKIKEPTPKQKMFDQKLMSKYEMIDSSDKALENHIISVLTKSKYNCMGKERMKYVTEISSAVLKHTKGDIKLALWITAMAQTESSFRLNANPKTSSARGFLQVIPRYHPELAKEGISPEDLYSDPSKSVKAGIIVFRKYLAVEHGDYQKATRRYRGLSVKESDQIRYYTAINTVYKKLMKDLQEYA